MTSEGARPSTAEGKAIDLDEADRLASMIRPAWELEEAARAALAESARDAEPLAAGGVDAATLDAAAKAFEPPRDTVIEGTPTLAIGKTDPGGAPAPAPDVTDRASAGREPARAPRRPEPAGPTKLGLGDDIAEGVAAADAGASDMVDGGATIPDPPRDGLEVTTALPIQRVVADLPKDALDEPAPAPASKRKKRPVAPGPAAGAPGTASFSKIDDPIEIPVKKGSKTALVLGACVVGAVLIGVGAMTFSGDEPAKKPEKAQPATETPREETKPAPTQEAAPLPSPSAAPTAAPAPTETSAPTTAPTVESPPIAEQPPSKPAGDKPPAGNKPPTSDKPPGGKPAGKPPPGKGGLMRDAPF